MFDAAIVNEAGIITNVLVFHDEQTMKDFGALLLSPGQGIGDKYITPEEYAVQQELNTFRKLVDEGIDS